MQKPEDLPGKCETWQLYINSHPYCHSLILNVFLGDKDDDASLGKLANEVCAKDISIFL